MHKLINTRARASFTIEAAIILPIIMLIILWLVTTSVSIHNQVVFRSSVISQVMENASLICDDEDTRLLTDSILEESGIDISLDNLDGRKLLLKYKLMKDGYHMITGGLTDED